MRRFLATQFFYGSVVLLAFLTTCQGEGTVVATESQMEGGDTSAQTLQLEYLELDLPERTYLVFRQELSLLDINGFLAIESDSLLKKAARANIDATGPLTSLFYVWDTEQGYGDAAVALPVATGTKLSPYASIQLTRGPALAVEFVGSYERLSAYHVALGQELTRRGLKAQPPSIEEYVVGPTQTSNPTEFRTRVIYPYRSNQ